MLNDYVWQQLHAQRESEHRERARHRGGDDTPPGRTRRAPALWLRLRAIGRPAARAAAPPALTSPATATVLRRAASRRTASDAPTAAALAWARLASGAGRLAPAAGSTEHDREAA